MSAGIVSYYLYRLAGRVAPHMAPDVGYRLAAMLGAFLSQLSPARINVEDNMAHVLGRQATARQVRELARQVFVNQCKNYFDLFRVQSMGIQAIQDSICQMQGQEHLESVLSRGRGAVIAGAHFGNIDVAGQLLAIRGFKVTALAERLQPERLFRYVTSLRESHGLRFIPIGSSLRPVFSALRANEIVGSAIDRDVTHSGRVTTFLGEPARLPDGYLRLALRTGAGLLFAVAYRLPDNRFQLVVEPEVSLQRTGDMERDVETNLPAVLELFGKHLRSCPQQWVLFQRVWLPSKQDPLADASHRRRALAAVPRRPEEQPQ